MPNSPWIVIRYPREIGCEILGRWWSANVMVADDTRFIWAKFAMDSQQLAQTARSLPAERFVLQGSWLIREGEQVATAQLPTLDWQPISQVLQFQLPWIGDLATTAQLPSVHWQLARGGQEHPLAGVLVNWDLLLSWVQTAPRARLEPLRYCLSIRDNVQQALVLGSPVPPLEALYLVSLQRILLPAGFQWLPAMDPECVQRSFQVGPNQWLFWQASDQWCLIDESTFVPLTRGSARLVSPQFLTKPQVAR